MSSATDVDGGPLGRALGEFGTQEEWEYYDSSRGVDAKGVLRYPLMFVLKGSKWSYEVADHVREKVDLFREWLKEEGIVVNGTFVKHYPFTSPSEAAGVLAGSSVSGFRCWERDRKTMNDWGFRARSIPVEFLGRRPVP